MAPEPSSSDVAGPSDADRERLLAAFIGRNWDRHYRASFAALRAGRPDLRARWNWAAALVPLWFAWRGLYLAQVAVCVAVPVLFMILVHDVLTFGSDWISWASVYAVLGIVEGYWGDRWLLARADRYLARVPSDGATDDAILKHLAKQGGGSLVGPLATVLGIYLVAVVLLPSLVNTMDPAYRAAMKSELRGLVEAQERYFTWRGSYAANFSVPVPSEADSGKTEPLYRRSDDIVTLTVALVGRDGWYATARHPGLNEICEIWVGRAPSHLQGTPQGTPTCRKP